MARGTRTRRGWVWGFLAAVTVLPFAAATRAENPIDEEKVGDSPYPVEFRVRVNEAIDRGVTRLRRLQQADGTWPSQWSRSYPMGGTALATLTLLKCGVKADDPAVVKAFAFLQGQPLATTYEVGVLLMALAAKYDGARDAFEADEPDRYGTKPKSPCASAISKDDLAWMKRGVEFLVNGQNAEGVWHYPGPRLDLSNTQYALLGLQAANRCGSLVPWRVWLAALEYLVKNQEAYGRPVMYRGNEVRGRYRFQWNEPALVRGFRYVPGTKNPTPTGSMTTAGLAGLIICQSELWSSRRFDAELRLTTRRGIRDAMAWLQEHYDVTANPYERADPAEEANAAPFGRMDQWYLYYMYGLERAGILGRFRFLGKHDWYFDGAEALLKQQDRDGGWGAPTETCFALLFLKRATTRHSAPVITPSDPAPVTPPKPAAPKPDEPAPGGPGGGAAPGEPGKAPAPPGKDGTGTGPESPPK